MNELTVVGCGTVVPEADRVASCYYVDLDGSRVLFDAGPGALQGLARLDLPWQRITDLAITHFHVDHVGALPGLFFAFKYGLSQPRQRPLAIWGPSGIAALLESLASIFGEFILDPGFPVEIHEMDPDTGGTLAGGTRLTAHKTPHTDESVAYRLDGVGGSFGYSGDSGPTETLGPFMSGVSVFVCECSLPDREVGDNHLSPGRVAGIARAADCGLLILTHVYPHLRRGNDVAGLVARAGYGGDVTVAHEGLRVALTNG